MLLHPVSLARRVGDCPARPTTPTRRPLTLVALAALAALTAGTARQVWAAAPVSAVSTYALSAPPVSYSVLHTTSGATTSLSFDGNIRRLASITAGAVNYPVSRGVIDAVVYRNPANPAPLDQRVNLRFETASAASATVFNLAAPYADTVESALRFSAINVGVDNAFVNLNNLGSQTSSIERIDILFVPLAAVSAAQLSSVVVPVFDRTATAGGSDPFRIAALLADAGGSCAAPVAGAQINSVASGASLAAGGRADTLIARRDPTAAPPDAQMRPVSTTGQGISGQVFTLADLGVAAGQTVCGVALFARDSTGTNPLSATQNPTATADAQGGLDLVAATGLFDSAAPAGTPAPPVANDDAPTAPFTPGSVAAVDVLDGGEPGLGADSDPNGNLDAASVVFVNPPPGATLGAGGKTLSVPGQGAWTVDATGVVRFTPAAGYTGDPTPVQYTVRDLTGLVSNPATVTLLYRQPPLAADDAVVDAPPGAPVPVPVTANDSDPNGNLDPASVVFVNPPAGATLSPDGKTLTVPGQGSWAVGAGGVVTYTPDPGFTGNPTPVFYTVADSTGLVSAPARIDITLRGTPPVAVDDSVPGAAPGNPTTVAVLANDSDADANLDPATVLLVNPPAGATLSPDGKILDVPGEGRWSVAASGTVSFTPQAGFTAAPTPVQYTVGDTTGRRSAPATIRVGAAGVPGVAPVPGGPWPPLAALLALGFWWQRRRHAR